MVYPQLQPQAGDQPERSFAQRLMNYFYPVHYQFGMEMERAMSQGRVDRKQSAMLWLIHARGGIEGWVRRREVVAELSLWFEISEPKISRMLRSLSSPPLEFIEIAETPESGREKMLRLTPEGRMFVEGMMGEAVAYLDARMAHMPRAQLEFGLDFLSAAFLPDGLAQK